MTPTEQTNFVELTRAIANVMGMTVEFRLSGWSEMRTALHQGTVDVLQGMSFSEVRVREIDFSLPHTKVNHAVFAHRDSPPACWRPPPGASTAVKT